jgi:ABC-type branched-subunit amino acid transport system ATPase component/branched-subunit amino acid ABC-type transport system permease component
MDKFFALLISGAVAGAVFSLIAVGLVLTYQTSRVFNFAQGAVAFSIALLYYELRTGLHWPVAVAAPFSILIVAPLLGLVLNAVVFRPLARADDAAKIVATVGILVALPALSLFILEFAVDDLGATIPKGDNILFPAGLGPAPKEIWSIGTWIRIDSNQVIVFVLGAVVAFGLWALVRTRVGLKMRATVERPELAEFRGVDTARTSRVVWMLGFALAGLAGVAGAPFFALTPVAYTGVLIVAAAAAVFGGLRSVPLAFAGGLLLGVAQSMFSGYATFAESIRGLSSALPYVLLFIALVVLVRDRSRVAGQVADAPLPPEYLDELPQWRRALPWVLAGTVLLLAILFFADDFWMGFITQGLAYSLIFLSFVVVTGLGGMVSLAQAAFAMQAALTTGLLISHGWPWLLALVVGVGSAVLLGVIVALPALKLGGLALALATLALAMIGDTVLFVWHPLSNGDFGWTIGRPSIGPFDFNDDRALALLLFAMVLVVAWLIRNLQRSPSGRAITAVRSAQAAATSVGLSTLKSKLRVFAVSAAVAGIGGVMLATVNKSITSLSFNALAGLTWLAVVVLFGVRRSSGAILAGILFALSPQLLGYVTSSTRVADILFGLGAVHLARAPDGILTQVAELAHRRRRKRAARSFAEVVVAPEPPPVAPREEPEALPREVRVGVVATEWDRHEALDVPAALTVEALSAGYGAGEVLHDVDLAVAEGRISLLLGSNGAGKSTLCNVVAGGLVPRSGTVLLGAEDVTHVRPHRRALRGLTFVPESRGIFPTLTVTENLALTLPDAADREAAFEKFPALKSRRRVDAGMLSGGEQQMLTLAPVLVHPPKVLVTDEPSLGLAPMIVEQVMQLFAELRRAGTSILIVEEKASHVLTIADEVMFLELGRIAWSGPAADVDFDRVAESYLQVGS